MNPMIPATEPKIALSEPEMGGTLPAANQGIEAGVRGLTMSSARRSLDALIGIEREELEDVAEQTSPRTTNNSVQPPNSPLNTSCP